MKGLRLAILTVAVAALVTAVGACKCETPKEKKQVKWSTGTITRVWRNGNVAGDIGTKYRVETGDYLLLVREGKVINTIKVTNVEPLTFFGRAMETASDAVMPQVGDRVYRGVQPEDKTPQGTD
jgi:hypothetical protein